MRVCDRVFAPLCYAETGYMKYTVLARSLAFDLNSVSSDVKAQKCKTSFITRTELCIGVFAIKFCALYSNKYRTSVCLSCMAGVDKHFLRRTTLKTSLLPGATYITPIIAFKALTETVYIS